MARITRDELHQFIARAIRHLANGGIGVTPDVHVRGEVEVRDGYIHFRLDDGSLVAIDPEWLVPRNYGDEMMQAPKDADAIRESFERKYTGPRW